MKHHQSILKKELQKWEDLIQKGSSISERLKQAEINEYIKEAIRTIEST